MTDLYDILVIGGGINGTAVARDAAGRGLSVCLCERDDLAQHTSSASTKLIHGGLRYLEYYEFKLVRDALREREVLLRAAPHIIWPMRFVLPYDDGLRPKWMIRAGLFLYDHIGGREELPGTQTVDLTKAPHAGLLEPRLQTGYEYSDCWVEDARLVVLNAVDAQARGADVLTRTEVVSITSAAHGFTATLSDGCEVRARAIVNAAGPWVDEVLGRAKPGKNDAGLRLVKGSHIVVPRLFEHDHSYIFQNGDGRVVFAIPYEGDYTLIGTTDVPYSPGEGKPEASAEEVAYLCEAANEYFAHDISPDDVAWTYSGVRPLYDDKSEDASAVTRDYVLDIDMVAHDGGSAPVLSVYGGKITTSRKLGQHVIDKLDEHFEGLVGPAWTRDAHLPGGDIPDDSFPDFVVRMTAENADMDPGVLLRLCRLYGSYVPSILARGREVLPGGLVSGEIHHLVAEEYVTRPDDVIWRRTKRGLHMSEGERAAFADWFAASVKARQAA